jgi:hypothetical protein
MTRRSFQRCLLWLLPLLILRAFVPAGFMVSADAAGLQLTLCPDQVSLPLADAHAGHHMGHGDGVDEHAGHHMQVGGAGDEHAAHHGGKHFESPCPFGIATVAVGPTLLQPARPLAELADKPFFRPSIRLAAAGPLRADRIRGPPRFS